MADGQSHIVEPWTFSLFSSKGPVSSCLQVSLFLLSIHLSFFHLTHLLLHPFNLLLSFPFHFLSLALSSFFIHVSLSTTVTCRLFMLAFPGSIMVSLYIQRSLIHYFPRFTLCPFLSLFFEIHWCFLSFMDIPHFHSRFSPLIPASFGAHVLFHGAVLVQAVKPCKGLCALTFKGNHVYLDMFRRKKLSFWIYWRFISLSLDFKACGRCCTHRPGL